MFVEEARHEYFYAIIKVMHSNTNLSVAVREQVY